MSAIPPVPGCLALPATLAQKPGGRAGGTTRRETPGTIPMEVSAFESHLRMAKDSTSGPEVAWATVAGQPAAPSVPLVQERGTPAGAPVGVAEELWPALVRKAAWSGDARRSTIRLELGAGTLAGATVLVHSEAGRVRVQLSAPPGVDLDGWRARIALRLEARGLEVDGVDLG